MQFCYDLWNQHLFPMCFDSIIKYCLYSFWLHFLKLWCSIIWLGVTVISAVALSILHMPFWWVDLSWTPGALQAGLALPFPAGQGREHLSQTQYNHPQKFVCCEKEIPGQPDRSSQTMWIHTPSAHHQCSCLCSGEGNASHALWTFTVVPISQNDFDNSGATRGHMREPCEKGLGRRFLAWQGKIVPVSKTSFIPYHFTSINEELQLL